MVRDEWISPNGRIRLILGDALEILPTLEAGSFDAVVTDPPYGIGFKYESHDDNQDDYCAMMKSIVHEMSRLEVACCFVWQAMLHADKWHLWFPPGFRLFAACKGFVQFRPTPVQYSWDPIVWWGDPQCEPSVYRKDYHEQRLAPFGYGRPRVDHPCPRPLEQVQYVCEMASPEGSHILDPFMGSGTTAIACIKTGRRFTGIEIEPKYFEIAKQRVKRELSQPMLPAFAPPKETQRELIET